MKDTELAVTLTFKMYECRAVLRRFASDYNVTIVKWMDFIDNASDGVGAVKAGMMMIKALMEKHPNDPSIRWIMAAVVELIEPDKDTPAFSGHNYQHG